MEEVLAVGDVVGRRRVALSHAEDDRRGVRQVPGPLRGGHHDGGRAVGLDAAVEQAQWLAHPRAREVVVQRELAAPHERLRVVLRVLPERERDLGEIRLEGPVPPLVTRRDPRVELRGRAGAVGQVEVHEHVGHRVGVEPATRATGARAGPEGGVAVPAHDDEHVPGDPGGDGHRRVLDRRGRRRAAHVDRRTEADRRDPEVRRELLDRRIARRRHHPVDVTDGQAGVRDRLVGDPEHHLDRQPVRAAQVLGLRDADDRRGARQAAHSPASLTGGSPRSRPRRPHRTARRSARRGPAGTRRGPSRRRRDRRGRPGAPAGTRYRDRRSRSRPRSA